MIEIIPAIDIRNGKVVRLTQGSFSKEKVYADSPVAAAEKWASCGAEMIHVVDLDGARDGEPRNLSVVAEIKKRARVRIELGGGIRTEDAIRKALDAGADKIVIGTRALDSRFLSVIGKNFKDVIVAGIDARNGVVQTKGWLLNTGTKAQDLTRQVEAAGIVRINYTDISRDGTLEGVNVESLKEILAVTKAKVIAGGGISSIADVRRLKGLEAEGLAGLIIGKALYEGKIDLGEAMRVCSVS